MEHRVEKITFGHGLGEDFRLETRHHPETPEVKHKTLFHGSKEIKVERRALDLLSLFLHHPKTAITEREIEDRLWGRDSHSNGNVEQQVYKLRTALNDNGRVARFIQTLPKFGYKFTADVHVEGTTDEHDHENPASVRTIERWDHEKYIRFLRETTHAEDAGDEEADLCILTTAFSSGVPDVIPDLLEKNVRIQILLVNEALLRARNRVRQDHSPDKAIRTLLEQRDTLATMKKRSRPGRLEVRETAVMPSGIIIRSRAGALIGMFLATESYVRGPMIEVGPRTGLWQILKADWAELWKDAQP